MTVDDCKCDITERELLAWFNHTQCGRGGTQPTSAVAITAPQAMRPRAAAVSARRITDGLSTPEAERNPGDEGDARSNPAA
jgi:hypothetical protein